MLLLPEGTAGPSQVLYMFAETDLVEYYDII